MFGANEWLFALLLAVLLPVLGFPVYVVAAITKNLVMSQKSIVPPPPDPPFDIETFEPIDPPW